MSEVAVFDRARRRSFIVLHVTLAIVVLVHGVSALLHAAGELAEHHHLALLGVLELVAALLFLWPRTLRVGGWVLVAVFVVGVVYGAARGEFPASPLVYAAATLYVTVHGAAWRTDHSELSAV